MLVIEKEKRSQMSSERTRSIVAVAMAVLVVVVAATSILLTLSGGFTEQTRQTPGIGTQEGGGQPPMFEYHWLNITVHDRDEKPLKNTWVVVFLGNVAKLYGYTDAEGFIAFELMPGTYQVQFERYHYVTNSTQVTVVDDDEEMSVTLNLEEILVFGTIPPWLIMMAIGIVAFVLAYLDRRKLRLGKWSAPRNWFGSSKGGSWTFIDKSTKAALYGVSGTLLVMLLVFVLPNFPSFRDMSLYYIALGIAGLLCLVLEGASKKYWVAAIGFGGKDIVAGDIVLSFAFAFVFMGATGFFSQLSIASLSTPMGSVLSIVMIVVVASYFEECFWSGALAPTIAEKGGIVASVFATSFLFMLAHGLAYGWAVFPLLGAFAFRCCVTPIVLYRKSWLGVFVAHALINALSLFSIMILS